MVETGGIDFGLGPIPLVLKLELMQRAGSFKTRGAFTNLLMRDVPPADVVAASGGNHGATPGRLCRRSSFLTGWIPRLPTCASILSQSGTCPLRKSRGSVQLIVRNALGKVVGTSGGSWRITFRREDREASYEWPSAGTRLKATNPDDHAQSSAPKQFC